MLPCAKILPCVQSCNPNDVVCLQQCEAQGTPKAKQLAKAVYDCMTSAMSGACRKDCPDTANPSAACILCLSGACFGPVLACMADV